MTKLHVLLADDHAVVREGLKALISAQPDMEVVGEASTGREAWQLAVQTHPDVVIMDISMPDLGGAEATELIRRDCPSAHVLALTVHEIEGYMRRLLEAGAMGYILKRAAATELVGAVRRVASGNVFIDPGIATDVISGFVAGAYRLPTPEPELTDRETQVVKLIALGHINREIAAQLNLSIKTIEVHKSRRAGKVGPPQPRRARRVRDAPRLAARDVKRAARPPQDARAPRRVLITAPFAFPAPQSVASCGKRKHIGQNPNENCRLMPMTWLSQFFYLSSTRRGASGRHETIGLFSGKGLGEPPKRRVEVYAILLSFFIMPWRPGRKSSTERPRNGSRVNPAADGT